MRRAVLALMLCLAAPPALADTASDAARLEEAGIAAHNQGRWPEALKAYREALALQRKRGDWRGAANTLINLAIVQDVLSNYAAARDYAYEALALLRGIGEPAGIAMALSRVGLETFMTGQYDQTQAAYRECLTIHEKGGDRAGVAECKHQLALVDRALGRYEQALVGYAEAEAYYREANDQGNLSKCLENKGNALAFLGRTEEARAAYMQAITIAKDLGDMAGVASSAANLAVTLYKEGRYQEALEGHQLVLQVHQSLGDRLQIAIARLNVAMCHEALGRYQQANLSYQELEVTFSSLGARPYLAETYTAEGFNALLRQMNGEAIWYFDRAIQTIETIRKSAQGEARRDYLATQITAYRGMADALVRLRNPEGALKTSEQARAKWLAETLAGTDAAVQPPSAEAVGKQLGDKGVALVYQNAEDPRMIQLAVSRAGVVARHVAPDVLLGIATPTADPAATLPRRRGVEIEAPTGTGALAERVQAYRKLLVTPGAANAEKARKMGRAFYDWLIAPLADRLAGKTELVVVPDGVLGFLPYETFVDPHGRYLGERFRITYAHSLTVLDQLSRRRYGGDREPLLAFGGAIYDPVAYDGEMAQTRAQVLALARQAKERGGSLKTTYAAMGTHWQNLPGTLSEVAAIAKVVPQSHIRTGDAVSEDGLKALAARGDLSRYKVLHFATHGMVTPEAPELSALVLSQFATERGGEDGYLRAPEIASLKLRADFVNLSACETGLGKLYGGEGVVGLAQAFLQAGANGLSLSLWSVADASTAKFMAEVYRSVYQNHVGYAEAIARTKRRFIQGEFGEAYRHPYYWAPFVYYGR